MRFFDLQAFQAKHKLWLEHNFPNQTPHQALLGVVEEVGELAHAHLKAEQGIRGERMEHRKDALDAIGDIIIYLASYCNTNDYDLETALMLAWAEVEQRDWIAYPATGRPPIDAG
jgi:NTP pyrophosphatase (non-canonical NTP hydrolase)